MNQRDFLKEQQSYLTAVTANSRITQKRNRPQLRPSCKLDWNKSRALI